MNRLRAFGKTEVVLRAGKFGAELAHCVTTLWPHQHVENLSGIQRRLWRSAKQMLGGQSGLQYFSEAKGGPALPTRSIWPCDGPFSG